MRRRAVSVVVIGLTAISLAGCSLDFNGLVNADGSMLVDSGMNDGALTDGSIADSGMTDGGMTDGGPIIPVAPGVGDVVLSEVRTGTGAVGNGAFDELVELYNRTNNPIDLGSGQIQYSSSAGSSWTTYLTLPADATIPAHGYYLTVGSMYSGGVASDAPGAFSSGFAQSGGHVRILVNALELDRFGWGTASIPETTAYAAAADDAGSYERKALTTSTAATMMGGGADELKGNGEDSGDNSMDFIRRATSDPQNSASAAEMP